jgi:hypothetical protein
MKKSYTGSKSANGVFQTIIGQMPPHSVYVEPFFGSGQIFWKKRRADTSIVFDVARDLTAKAGAEGVIAQCGNALELLPGLSLWLPPDAVIYCDPPYPLATRNNRIYYNDLLAVGAREMTDREHVQLLTMLQTIRCRILISTLPNELYRSALTLECGWRRIEYQTRAHRRTLTEWLFCNFPEPDELHDWRFAGRNFRERWRMTKLVRRTIAKLEAMNKRERGYVLDAISQRREWRGLPAPSATNGAVGRSALAASARVAAKVVQDKNRGGFIGTCRLGQLEVFQSAPREEQMQAMLDIQDWAFLHGKTPQFENA